MPMCFYRSLTRGQHKAGSQHERLRRFVLFRLRVVSRETTRRPVGKFDTGFT